jgi:hypothetical protein
MPIVLAAPALGLIMAVTILIAAFYLLILLARPLSELLKQVPVVGAQLSAATIAVIQTAQHTAQQFAAQYIDPLVETIWVPIHALMEFVDILMLWMSTATTAMIAMGGALAGGGSNVGHQLGQIVNAIASMGSQIGQLVSGLAAVGRSLATALATTIPGMITSAVAALQAWFQTVLARQVQVLNKDIAEAEALAVQLVAMAGVAAAAGLADLSHQLDHTAAALAAAVVAAGGTAKLYTDQLGRSIELELGDIRNVAIPTAVGVAIAATTAITTRINDLERNCINPACGALGVGLSLFSLLAQGAELLLIVGLIIEARSNPERAGKQLADGAAELVAFANGVLGALGIRV